MREEIFKASDKTKTVTALGMPLNYNVADIHIYVDGVEITKAVVWEEITVTAEVAAKPEEKK